MKNPRPTVTATTLVLAVTAFAGCSATTATPSDTKTPSSPSIDVDLSSELMSLEEEFDARVGVSALDTGTQQTIEFQEDERFGFASTLKALVAAEFLRQVPTDARDDLTTWSQADVDAAGYSPVTSEHVVDGLTLAELAEAAVRESDNAATNLILNRIGGAAGMSAALVDLGDTTTRVVNDEPALNTIEPGSIDDTTTAAALTTSLAAYLEPGILNDADRRTLLNWMSGNATGDALVRAGAPAGWTVADKSGGAGAIRNDLAVVFPPDGDPIVISILTEKNDPAAYYDDRLVARTAEVVLGAFD